MRKYLVWACGTAILTIVVSATAIAQRPKSGADDEGTAGRRTLNPQLIGTWRATPDRLPLSTDFDKSVWGPDAISVRDVTLTIRQSGEGTLTVTRKVVDARGRTKAASTSIEEAQLRVEGAAGTPGPRVEHAVQVVSAERRYPDDPGYKWPLDGLKVKLATFDDTDSTIEVRVDTPEGKGSFWETLRRQGRAGGTAKP